MEGTVYQERAAQSQVYIGLVAAVCFVGGEVCGAPGIDSQQQQVETKEDCLLGLLNWPFCLYALRGDELPALDQAVLPPEVCASHVL